MRTTEGATHQDPAILSSTSLSGDMRKHVLAGLAIAKRSLANAKDDVALGCRIAPETIAELERTVAEYVNMLGTAETSRDQGPQKPRSHPKQFKDPEQQSL